MWTRIAGLGVVLSLGLGVGLCGRASAGSYSDRRAVRPAAGGPTTDGAPAGPTAEDFRRLDLLERRARSFDAFVRAVNANPSAIHDYVSFVAELGADRLVPGAPNAAPAAPPGPESVAGPFTRAGAKRRLDALADAPQPAPEATESAEAVERRERAASRAARARRIREGVAPISALATRLVDEGDLPDDLRLWPGIAQAAPTPLDATALASARTESARAAFAVDSVRIANLTDLSDAGIFIQRSFGSQGPPKGALLTFDRNLETDVENFTAEGCIGWRPHDAAPIGASWWSWQPVVALSASFLPTQKDRANHWGVNAGVDLAVDLAEGQDRGFTNRRTRRLEATLSGSYQRSQDGGHEDYGFEVAFTPVFGAIGLNVRRGQETRSWPEDGGAGLKEVRFEPAQNLVSGEWVLSFDGAAGWTSDRRASGGTSRAEDVHGRVAIGGRVFLDHLGRLLTGVSWDEEKLPYVDAIWSGWAFSNGETFRHGFDASLCVPINKVWRIEVSYHDGVDEESLLDLETFHLGLTILL